MNDDASNNNLQDDTEDQVNTLATIESMINSHQARIEKLREDAKPIREMVNDLLINDESYNKLEEIAKKASGEKSSRKRELLQTPNGQSLQAKLDDIKTDLADAQEALSDYLGKYRELTGSNEYETPDGDLREIVYTAKLVRKRG